MFFSDELFVTNLASETSQKDLSEIFSEHGAVKECWVGQKKGGSSATATIFGSVRMDSHEAALSAKKALDGADYLGKRLSVKWGTNQRVLWVGSLPTNVTNEELQTAFSQFGTVGRAVVAADGNGVSHRFGFVWFEDKREASKALEACQKGALLFAKSAEPIRVEFAKFQDVSYGFTDEVKRSKLTTADAAAATAVQAHMSAPGSAEYQQAMHVKQLQKEYQQTKAWWKSRIAEASGKAPTAVPGAATAAPAWPGAQAPTAGPAPGQPPAFAPIPAPRPPAPTGPAPPGAGYPPARPPPSNVTPPAYPPAQPYQQQGFQPGYPNYNPNPAPGQPPAPTSGPVPTYNQTAPSALNPAAPAYPTQPPTYPTQPPTYQNGPAAPAPNPNAPYPTPTNTYPSGPQAQFTSAPAQQYQPSATPQPAPYQTQSYPPATSTQPNAPGYPNQPQSGYQTNTQAYPAQTYNAPTPTQGYTTGAPTQGYNAPPAQAYNGAPAPTQYSPGGKTGAPAVPISTLTSPRGTQYPQAGYQQQQQQPQQYQMGGVKQVFGQFDNKAAGGAGFNPNLHPSLQPR